MKISEVKLKNEGLEVVWEKYELKKGVSFRVEHKDKRSAPVQEELLKCFENLREHMIAIAGYPDTKQANDATVTSVKVGSNGGLILKGNVCTINSLYMNVATPEATNDDYEEYEALKSIFQELLSEVKAYMETDKMMSMELYIKKQNAKNENFNESEFESLSQEEKLKMYIDSVEKAGGIVMMPEDISFDNEEKVEPFIYEKPKQNEIPLEGKVTSKQFGQENTSEGKIIEMNIPEPELKKAAGNTDPEDFEI